MQCGLRFPKEHAGARLDTAANHLPSMCGMSNLTSCYLQDPTNETRFSSQTAVAEAVRRHVRPRHAANGGARNADAAEEARTPTALPSGNARPGNAAPRAVQSHRCTEVARSQGAQVFKRGGFYPGG